MSARTAKAPRARLYSCVGALALVTAAGMGANAQSAESQQIEFNLPAQSLEDALKSYGVAAERQVMVSTDLVEGKMAPAVIGEMTAEDALEKILNGSGLAYRVTASDVVLVGDPKERAFAEAEEQRGFFRVAQTDAQGSRTISEEIVVTATKRSESIQDVPVSVTALTESDITRAGYKGFRDWADQVPGISALGAGKNRVYFVVRGVTTSISGQNTQDPVAVYIGDVPVTDTNFAFITPDLRLFDVNRVEVLRGPQGTTFGSGAMGGAVRVIVNEPDLNDFSLKAQIELQEQDGGGFLQGYDGAINFPIVNDRLALRVVGYYVEEDGYVDNVGTGIDRADHFRGTGARGLLKWQITDDFSATASVIHQTAENDDGYSINPTLGAYTRSTPLPLPTTADFNFYNLTLDADLGWATLYSSTTYAQKSSFSLGDLTSLGQLFAPIGVSVLQNEITDESDTIVQELRLASDYEESKFDWILGGYYRDFDRASPFRAELIGLSDLGIPGADDDCLLCIVLTLPGKEYAVFGEVGYQLTEQLKFSAAARVSWFDTTYQDLDGIDRVSNLFAYLLALRTDAPPSPRAIDNRSKDNKITPKFTLTYTPNDDLLFYGSVAQGYRLGQNNPNFGPDPILGTDGVFIPANYEPDSLWSYELGWKFSLLDNVLTANGAVYYSDWKDIQISQARPSDQLTFIANAGEAHTTGVELELFAQPTSTLSLQASLTYQEAKIDVGAPLAGSEKGDRLPGVPDISASAIAEYTVPLGGSGWSSYFRGNVSYVGESVNGFPNAGSTAAFSTFGDYTLAGLSLGAFNERFDITLFLNNVTDAEPDVLLQPSGVGNFRTTVRPRTIGIRLNTYF